MVIVMKTRIPTLVLSALLVVAAVAGMLGVTGAAGATTTVSSPLVWQPPVQIDAVSHAPTPDPIRGISCATSSLCAAVDSVGNILMYNGTSWTQSSVGTSAGSPDSGPFVAVSCPTASFCAAVGTASAGVYALWNGAAWATPQSLPTMPPSNSADTVESLSCASSAFCMAGFYNGDYATYNGSTWTLYTYGLPFLSTEWTVPGSGSSATWIDGPVASVSCPTTSFCAASSPISTASYGNSHYILLTATWNGTSWSPGSNPGQSVPVDPQISCGSADSCVVVQGSNGFSDQPAVVYNGSTWTVQSQPDDTANVMDAVSCPAATSCVGVDSAGNAVSYNGTSWGTPVPVFSGTAANVISCPTTTFCAAGAADGAVSVLSSAGWSTPAVIATTPVPGTPRSLQSISCPTTTFCAAVDDEGYVVTMNGTSWSAPVSVDSGYFTSVSCPTTTFCVAVDNDGYTYTYNGTSWSAPVSLGGFSYTNAVSCATDAVCTAVMNDVAYQWDGSAWTDVGDVGPINSLSCTSATFCMGVGVDGFSAWFDPTGTAGAIVGTQNSSVDYSSVSCASSSMCVAVDSGNGEAVTWNGTALSTPTVIDSSQPYLVGVSCPTATTCVAVSGVPVTTVPTAAGTENSVNTATSDGSAIYYNGTSWSAPTSIDTGSGGPTSISCASAGECIVVDAAGNEITGAAPPTTCPPLTPTITITSGSGQSAQVGDAFTKPLTASVTCNGGPDTSPVTWTSPTSGASGTLTSTGADTATVTANTTTGTWTATATIDGVSATAKLTNTAAPAKCTTRLAIHNGGQVTRIGADFAAPLIVDATCGTAVVPHLAVTVTLAPNGGSFVTGSTTDVTTTNPSGVATTPLVVATTNPVTWVATASAPGAQPTTTVLTNTPVPVAPVTPAAPALVNSGHPGPPTRGNWWWISIGGVLLVISLGAGVFVIVDRKRGRPC